MEERRKLNPLIPILAGLLVLVSALCIFLLIKKNKAEQLAETYKNSYDSIVEEMESAKRAEEEAKQKQEQEAKDYQSQYNDLVYSMLDDAVLAENIGNLIISVWHNAIWEVSDVETDKYTKVNGVIVSDFNDALMNLFNDAEYSRNLSTLSDNQWQVKEKMKKMLNPPEGYENAFKALESMYNSYISFTNIVLRCEGSLESFSNDFGDADETLNEQYHGAELYVKQYATSF